MARVRGWGLAAALLTSAGCAELVEDSGRACVLPQDLICECSGGEPCGPQLAVWNSQLFPCEGLYPSGTALELEVFLRLQSFAPASDAQCSVEVFDHRIIVSASYGESTVRHENDPWVVETCAIPSLESGTWTLVYDGEEQDFVVGEPSPQPMACVGTI